MNLGEGMAPYLYVFVSEALAVEGMLMVLEIGLKMCTNARHR